MAKISFLGAGRMASAMVDGLLAKGARPADLACTSGPDDTARQLAARTGIAAQDDLAALLSGADAVVLACKPQQLASLDPRLIEFTAGKLVLSILAGKRLDRLVQTFPKARNVVRAMPNTPGQIGAGVTGWCAKAPLTAADEKLVGQILGSLGKTVALREDQLDAVTGLSGSGPAYVFEFAAALREAGIAVGLDRETAKMLAVETLLGSARLLAQSTVEAEELRNQVTSPNGTTYAGLQQMNAKDFRGLIRETVVAATARSVELSKDA
ncbi:MAG TPA: pyrroline-5-carboxylate reductase [Opitutaceae bacterium]|nr:pyrroline-5-carboxylate reductase [Opitutaceae bacterium]